MKKEMKIEYHNLKKELRREYRERLHELKDGYGLTKNHSSDAFSDPPKRSVLEEIGNAITHGLGAIFALVAYLLMIFRAGSSLEVFSVTVYCAGMFIMFTMSCLYHSFRHGSAVKRLFRRFDYSCIYLLIGATFAPILTLFVGGKFGITFFVIQWIIIATGIALVAVFGPNKFRALHITLYFLLGWSGLLFVPSMIARNMRLFAFILAGGVVYSLGIIPFVLKKKVAHFIWHFFVLGGAIVQCVGVFALL